MAYQGPRRRRQAGLRRVGEALAEVVRELGLEARRGDAEVMAAWAPLVGPAIAKASVPLGFRDGVLELGVAGAAWSNEIKLLTPQLLAKLAEALGPGRVRALRTKVVGREGVAAKAKPAPGALPSAPQAVGPPWAQGSSVGAAPPEERARWAEASFQISDPKLAAAVARAGAALADLQAARAQSGALPCRGCGAPCGPADGGKAGLCPPCAWQAEAASVRPDTAAPDQDP